MRTKNKMLVTVAILLNCCALIPAFADDGSFEFQLRNTKEAPSMKLRGILHHDQITLKDELKNASKWGLRKVRNKRLQSSLLLSSINTNDKPQLRSYLYTAINTSAALRSTLHEANANYHKNRATFFNFFPKASLTTDIEKEKLSNTINSQTRIALDWNIYSSGEKWGAHQSTRWSAIASDLQFLATERQVFLEKITIYIELSARKKILDEIKETINRLNTIRNNVRLQYSAGLTSLTDIAQIDAEIATVKIELESAEFAFRKQKSAYSKITGTEAPVDFVVPSVDHLIPNSKQDALTKALDRNFTLDSAIATANSAAANSRSVRGSFLPQVSLYSSSTISNTSSNNGREWSTGIRLSVPLADLSSMAGYQEARQKALAATYRSRDARYLLVNDVEANWLEYQSMKRQRHALKQQQHAIERTLVGLRKELKAGLRPASDILREEIELTNVRVEMINLELRKTVTAYRIAAQFSDLSLNDLTVY